MISPLWLGCLSSGASVSTASKRSVTWPPGDSGGTVTKASATT
jgi:hypothetical protein